MPPIDRSAVHRSTRTESLVGEIEAVSEQSWQADVELPRSHWLCHPVPDRVPVTLIAEAFRQAGLAICIEGLGMGHSVHFVISTMTVSVQPEGMRFPRFGAIEGKLDVAFAGIRHRKGIPHVLEVEYELPGVASGRVEAQVLTDADYRVIRRNAAYLDERVMQSERELVQELGREDGRIFARLGVDEADPFFFDHAVDHLPGMLLLHSTALIHDREHGAQPGFLRMSFPAFGELRVATQIEAEVTSHGVSTSFTQGGRLIASGSTSDEHNPS